MSTRMIILKVIYYIYFKVFSKAKMSAPNQSDFIPENYLHGILKHGENTENWMTQNRKFTITNSNINKRRIIEKSTENRRNIRTARPQPRRSQDINQSHKPRKPDKRNNSQFVVGETDHPEFKYL
jgi:hypothetical protein